MSAINFNLVYNAYFEYFSNQIEDAAGSVLYNHPDGWLYSDKGTGGRISKVNDFCSILTSNGAGEMVFKQQLHEFPRWKQYLLGRTISAKIRLSLPSAANVSLILSDGFHDVEQTISQQGDHCIKLKMKVGSKAEVVSVSIASSDSGKLIYIESVTANLGNRPKQNLACIVSGSIGERRQYIAALVAPPRELSLCAEPLELTENQSRLDSVINKKFGAGPNGRSLLPDMRGYFSRAVDRGAGVDKDATDRVMLGNSQITGDYPGTWQADAFYQHSHSLGFVTATNVQGGGGGMGLITGQTTETSVAGGKETRSQNIAELYTIKWA
ncbi:hypothetical protein MIB92_05475 [Aestuariirhabdus sp. Z084]|uniref:hypothetical protein n=1 Tax=Aestuariirhabdus haliotis TaxID=2918751 RepID=UPI00201B3F72|nr:hypothetical protein [Aestuariirhabdus haliotis]MCL6415092.1 hypothetical protein [Aestuariirhabdus haliotis]MCL6419024.1 hypothetical protein [Aestuariirhabdus haliotis]